MSLLGIFASAVLPVVSVAAVGFALGRFQGVDPDALNTVTVFVLAPALVVHSLATTTLSGPTMVNVLVTVLAFTAGMILLAETVGRATGYTEPLLGAFVLASIVPNAGNYGIPLADFAFGPTGRSVAVLVTAIQGVQIYTVGVYIAARGGSGSSLASMRRVFSVPLVYAVVVALGVRWIGAVPPAESTFMQTLELLGNASIPIMLLILGVQLANVDVEGALRPVGVASGLKLLVAPFLALGVALLVGFENETAAKVVVLLLATPTGVSTIILTGAFSVDTEGLSAGEFASAAVLLTTVASVLTVTALVVALQSGLIL